ncbi:hypothetical protein QVD17_02873 [Tagetes erecta]|uniref:Uncharacterized protein n=1 Tax=Tagetes erecta TaxID=13708 RepID=A0AAD8P854_TARER|nr:hypothetical protein QVD17_02873 [Tagetes erecta]
MASTSSNHSRKQHAASKSMEMEEIVKYMSSLPSYLERGKPVHDRALNFGVLDWGRLEQWQYHQHKQSVATSNKDLPSGSSSSKRSSLHSHLNISTEEISTKDAPVGQHREKKNTNRSRTKPKGLEKIDLHPQVVVESKSSDDMGSFQTAAASSSSSSSSTKGKMKIQDSSYGTCDDTNHSNPKTDDPNSYPFKNEIFNRKSSKYESDSKRKSSITCQIKTPKEKESSVSSKNSNSKTSNFADTKNHATRILETPPVSQISLDGKNRATRTSETPPVSQISHDSKNRATRTLETPLVPQILHDSKNRTARTLETPPASQISHDSKNRATRALEAPPVSQISHEDLKIKAKVKMDLGNCKEVRVDNSCRNKMNDSSSSSSSRKQALFQMTVKNGRPVFTYSVDDNKNNIVAATVRSLSGKDDTNSWVYTFFTVQEVKKKKSGWLYHSTKDKGNGYLPNVTAEMKVSNPSVSSCTTREFVLSSVDSGEPEHENELAAIVVRFLRKEEEDENQDCFNTTVILPGGHHSAPRKGEPSPLIERWRSGGRCDCGGWDVGCRLRTLTNKVQSNRRSNPPESFELYIQGEVPNERPFFSLSPINEGIFSVNYNASLQLLHAFSICISVIECRKSSRHTALRTYVAKRVDDDDDVTPVTYASLPPVSPVGRV